MKVDSFNAFLLQYLQKKRDGSQESYVPWTRGEICSKEESPSVEGAHKTYKSMHPCSRGQHYFAVHWEECQAGQGVDASPLLSTVEAMSVSPVPSCGLPSPRQTSTY